jgi:hypothetical protein
MYAMATCLASILRRQDSVDEYGDPAGQYVPVVSGVIASIIEAGNTVFDRATQTPRAVRSINGTFPYGTDVQVGDRVRDDTHSVTYVVMSTTVPRTPGYQPDLVADLKKVTD